MLKKEKKLIVTYHTSYMAFATENACKAEKIKGELISAPREFSVDCGIAYATDPENKDKLDKVFRDNKIEYDKMVELEA